jgi:hypothetical protein
MLANHMAAVEAALLQTAKIPANAGHSLHKGTPRETFVKKFLGDHLPETLTIGQGEIISADSRPGESRNQFEIVLYKRQFPKLFFGADINAFLVESVVATIEVKSLLTKEELRTAVKAAANVKRMRRQNVVSLFYGHVPPAPLCYVVAYNGPAKLETIRDWLVSLCAEEGIELPLLPPVVEQRYNVACPTIDGVFLLGQGFVQFDNQPLGFLRPEQRLKNPEMRYYIGKTADGTLLTFFLFLTSATAGLVSQAPNLVPYLATFAIEVVD